MKTLVEQAEAVKATHDETLALTKKLAGHLETSGKLSKADKDRLAAIEAKDAKRKSKKAGAE